MFSAVVARAILQNDIVRNKPGTTSVEATQAYGLAIGFLRHHLISSPDKVSDLVICTMVLLIAFDVRIRPRHA